ncbi:MAG: S8 family serine peptidase [Clostridia bacterium]|nr:S8 family serine peptidase [Clostridia bacterium]
MKKFKTKALIIFLCFMFIFSSSSNVILAIDNNNLSEEKTKYQGEYIDGEALVKFSNKEISGDNAKILSDLQNSGDYQIVESWSIDTKTQEAKLLSDEPCVNNYALVKSDSLSTDELIKNLSSRDDIEIAEPNSICKVSSPLTNDPDLSLQWHLAGDKESHKVINIESFWDNNIKGEKESIVAIIDTGVDYTHEDLKDNMWHNPYKEQGLEGEHGYDFANNDSYPMDDNGHGTHCAGILGAVGNNGIGISGVAQNVSIMALKFLQDDGRGAVSDAISCYEYVIKAKDMGANIVVINNSWGDVKTYSEILEEIVETAGQKGMLSICAAGNQANNNDITPEYPSCLNSDYVVSVGNRDYDCTLYENSSYGKKTVDITAPGTAIYSTYKDGSYGYMTGTSMATPVVSGTVALLKQLNKNLTPLQIKEYLLLSTLKDGIGLEDKSVSGGYFDLKLLVENNLKELKLVNRPDKIIYQVGEELDLTGMIVCLKATDGSLEKINKYTVSGFDSKTAGIKTIEVSYLDKKVTFEVEVKQNSENLNGWMQVSNGEWIYYKNGRYLTGWQNDIAGWEGQWFYFDELGRMKTGWQNTISGWEGQWFYFNENGTMKIGWQNDIAGWNGKWFYFDQSGVMKTGWVFVDAWYYFDSNGVMYENTVTPDGYYVDINGRWI